MSIKTLRKRIALVAVSALGVGLLSVAPASAAAWVADDLIFLDATDDTGISNQNTLLDYCADLSTATVQSVVIPATSSGVTFWLGASGVEGTDTGYISITGPGAIAESGTSFSPDSPTSASVDAAALNNDENYVVIKPTGLGTIKVNMSATSTSAVVDIVTIDVVAVCGGGAYSLAAGDNSYIVIDTTADETDETQPANDILNADTVTDEGTGLIYFTNYDEYGQNPLSRALVTSASGGCYVDMLVADTSAAAPSPTSVTDVALSSTDDEWIIGVEQITTGAPATCTITTSWNGVTIGTKTIKFTGAPAKIVISDVTVGYRGGVGHLRATVTDAAGNPLGGKTVTASATEANNAASSTVVTVSAMTAATAAVTGKTPTVSAGSNLQYSCTNKGGAAKITVRVLKDLVNYITSAPADVYCGEQTIDTWSMSLDKAQYAPGEIATLTISGKGAYGTAVHTFAQMGADVAAAFGGMEFVTAPTTADYFTSGIGTRTYQLKVGTTEGAFVGTFKLTATTDTAAKTVQYKIVNQNAAVSTNEVLAAIVKLIATINKQIRQLQKQLRR